jgi:hypothetical protein
MEFENLKHNTTSGGKTIESEIMNNHLSESLEKYLLAKENRNLTLSFISTSMIMIYMLTASLSMGFAKLAKIQADSSLGSQVFAHFLQKYISYIRFFTFLQLTNLANGLY